jgi:hypothetical protein
MATFFQPCDDNFIAIKKPTLFEHYTHSDPAFYGERLVLKARPEGSRTIGGRRIWPPEPHKAEILHSAEFTLSRVFRFFASPRMTEGEGLRSE